MSLRKDVSIIQQADSIILGYTTFHYKKLLSVIYGFKKSEPLGACLQLCMHICAFACTRMSKASHIKSIKQCFLFIAKQNHQGD